MSPYTVSLIVNLYNWALQLSIILYRVSIILYRVVSNRLISYLLYRTRATDHLFWCICVNLQTRDCPHVRGWCLPGCCTMHHSGSWVVFSISITTFQRSYSALCLLVCVTNEHFTFSRQRRGLIWLDMLNAKLMLIGLNDVQWYRLKDLDRGTSEWASINIDMSPGVHVRRLCGL